MIQYELYDETKDVGIFYVYELHNPIKDKVFYVGKGKNDRFSHHFTKKSNNHHKVNTINEIISLGEKVIVKIVYRTNCEIDAFNKESELILKYGRRDMKNGLLTNLTNGGDGASGYIPTTEVREKWSKLRKGDKNGMYDRSHSDESKLKMTETRLRKYKSGEIQPTKHTDEFRRNLSERNTKNVDDNLIIELNRNGLSVNEIVKETDITREIILNRLLKYNLPNNSKKEKHVDISLICNMLTNGIEKYKICEEFNISMSTLNRKLKKLK